MIVAFDPVAREVEIDLEDGSPRLVLPARTFTCKVHGQEGIFFAESVSADVIDFGFIPTSDVITLIIFLDGRGHIQWRAIASHWP